MTTTRRLLAMPLLASLAAASLAAPPDPPATTGARAGVRRILLGRDLQPSAADLVALDARRPVYHDESGRSREASPGDVLALVPERLPLSGEPPLVTPDAGAPAPRAADTGVLELTTGERLPGDLATAAGAKDTLVWRHPRLGHIEVPLDSVRRAAVSPEGVAFIHAPAASDEPGSGADRILLLNGDRLSGFVLSMGETAEVKVGPETVKIQTALISGMVLGGARPARHSGPMVWLDDGTAVGVATLASPASGAVHISLPGGQSASYALSAVLAIAFDASRFAPLSEIPPRDQRPVGERELLDRLRTRRVGAVSPLNADDIELPEPMRVAWPMPPGARRFSALAEMPRAAFPWGDCDLVISIDGKEALRERLSESRPSVEINLAVTGKEIAAAVEPGRYGPINDRVTLRRAVFLLDPPAAPAPGR